MDAIKPSINFKIANATVRKTYSEPLETLSEQVVTIVEINGLDDLGLIYNPEKNLLIGEALTAGEYQLTVCYHYLQQLYTEPMQLVINNNPKDLWKTIASDSGLKYWKADEDYQGLDGLNIWKLVAASQRGRSHAHIGSCRDDDFALKVNRENCWHIIAVADGAGSSCYSREGARLIVNHSTHILNQQFERHNTKLMDCFMAWQQSGNLANRAEFIDILYEIFAPTVIATVDKLAELVKNDNGNFKDYYSTLLLAAHKPLAEGSLTIAYWIGDGALALYKERSQVELLGDVDSGDYAGQTRFLGEDAKNPDDIKKRIRFSFDDNITALILMTDGVSDPFFETNNNLKQIDCWDDFLHHKIFPHLSEDPKTSAIKINKWLNFWSPGNHDDRTFAIIYR